MLGYPVFPVLGVLVLLLVGGGLNCVFLEMTFKGKALGLRKATAHISTKHAEVSSESVSKNIPEECVCSPSRQHQPFQGRRCA